MDMAKVKYIICLMLFLADITQARLTKYERETRRLRLARHRQEIKYQKQLRKLELEKQRLQIREKRRSLRQQCNFRYNSNYNQQKYYYRRNRNHRTTFLRRRNKNESNNTNINKNVYGR